MFSIIIFNASEIKLCYEITQSNEKNIAILIAKPIQLFSANREI